MQQAGDDDGMADWLNIMLAIKKLQQNRAAPARR